MGGYRVSYDFGDGKRGVSLFLRRFGGLFLYELSH